MCLHNCLVSDIIIQTLTMIFRPVAVTEGMVRLCETQHCIRSGIYIGTPRDVLAEA